MRCTSPITVGFYSDGKTLCWSPRKYCKEYPTFKIPCGKCISCRLEYARQTAIRCTHEASTWPENCFLTLTYSDENLGDNKLNYQHIQKFMKGLRNYRYGELLKEMFPTLPQKEQRTQWNQLPPERKKQLYEKIQTSVFVAGEYGARTKRAHWHLLIFNWRPKDASPKCTTPRGDKVYTSDTLGELWPYGISEFGDLTFESAGYCARYAAKKLVHGKDNEHEYKPISKRSSKNAIGKRWIEKKLERLLHQRLSHLQKRRPLHPMRNTTLLREMASEIPARSLGKLRYKCETKNNTTRRTKGGSNNPRRKES